MDNVELERKKAIIENFRVARDQIKRAENELARALTRLGSGIVNWYYETEDLCVNSTSHHTVGVVEIYTWVAEMAKECEKKYEDAKKEIQDPLVESMKRGNPRKSVQYMDSTRGVIPLGICAPIDTEVEEELPTIKQAPRDEE